MKETVDRLKPWIHLFSEDESRKLIGHVVSPRGVSRRAEFTYQAAPCRMLFFSRIADDLYHSENGLELHLARAGEKHAGADIEWDVESGTVHVRATGEVPAEPAAIPAAVERLFERFMRPLGDVELHGALENAGARLYGTSPGRFAEEEATDPLVNCRRHSFGRSIIMKREDADSHEEVKLLCVVNGKEQVLSLPEAIDRAREAGFVWVIPTDYIRMSRGDDEKTGHVATLAGKPARRFLFVLLQRASGILKINDACLRDAHDEQPKSNLFQSWAYKAARVFLGERPYEYTTILDPSHGEVPAYRLKPGFEYLVVVGVDGGSGVDRPPVDWGLFEQ